LWFFLFVVRESGGLLLFMTPWHSAQRSW